MGSRRVGRADPGTPPAPEFVRQAVEMRHLRYFVAAAEDGHVTRSAARLGIQQPPLSAQIKALEAELGTALLTRHARSGELTVGGHALLDRARSSRALAVSRHRGWTKKSPDVLIALSPGWSLGVTRLRSAAG